MNAVEYFLNTTNPNRQYISFEVHLPVTSETTEIHLPRWRPGRYELGNFAKNVRDFSIIDKEGKTLSFSKINKDTWKVETSNLDKIIVNYNYYAAELNAGSTYLDSELLYVNPVNCFIFSESSKHLTVNVHLPKIENSILATGAEKTTFGIKVANFDELADSPFILSSHLQELKYTVEENLFSVWFYGIDFIPKERLIEDFKKFTTQQIKDFGSFPCKHFHFLNLILPYPAYHGVEHLTSTVITLGPTYSVFDSLYPELLGVSSHELYHVWNVKTMRPETMVPYNFKSENYSKLGWIYEGITTYLGDKYLYTSGVFNEEQYLLELTQQLQKHFDNSGRLHYSVADSSFDTWLDGYVPGVPGRKVSIYTEGCLIAFILDAEIRKSSSGSRGIENVMGDLFQQIGNGISYTEKDIDALFRSEIGEKFDQIKLKLIEGNNDFLPFLKDALAYFNWKLELKTASNPVESHLGFKYSYRNSCAIISSIWENSPGDQVGLMIGDEIVRINGIKVNSDLEHWFSYFHRNQVSNFELEINNLKGKSTLNISWNQTYYFPKVVLTKSESLVEETALI